MGGWNSKGKREADSLKKIGVNFLRKHQFFKSGLYGVMTWTNEMSEQTSSVNVQTFISDSEDNYLRIYYSQTTPSGEKTDFDYKIPLVTTPCRFGGKRYWFICPMYRNNEYCGRRVGILYKNGKFFACRHCYKLTYASQNCGGRYKGFVSLLDIDRAEMEVKRYFYRGKPTRKYRKVIRLSEKFKRDCFFMWKKFDTENKTKRGKRK